MSAKEPEVRFYVKLPTGDGTAALLLAVANAGGVTVTVDDPDLMVALPSHGARSSPRPAEMDDFEALRALALRRLREEIEANRQDAAARLRSLDEAAAGEWGKPLEEKL